MIHPDWVNNINRAYKAPLSVHKDADAVVTPMDPVDPDYSLTPLEDVDDELIDETVAWAESFTAPSHTGTADALVANLWPEEYERADGWREALEAWVARVRREEKRAEQREQAERERRERRREERQRKARHRPDSIAEPAHPITTSYLDVDDALDAISIEEVAQYHASDAWDTGRSTSSKTEFDPSWRNSSSGSSCYVDTDVGGFGDPGQAGGGYVVKLMALGAGIVSDASVTLSPEEISEAIDELRLAGYDIPVWIPEKGSGKRGAGWYDKTPLWALREAALLFGVVADESDFVERETDDGETYRGLDDHAYNRTLTLLEEYGVRTGRRKVSGTPKGTPTDAEIDDDGVLKWMREGDK